MSFAALLLALAALLVPHVSHGQVIDACVNKKGSIRIVNDGGACRNSETALSWNQTGPEGPQGAVGPQGPKGDDGATEATGAFVRRVDVDAPGVNELRFDDIPQSATHLKLTFRGKLPGFPTQILRVQFNGTNYHSMAWWHNGANQSQMLEGGLGRDSITLGEILSDTQYTCEITGYAGQRFKKDIHCTGYTVTGFRNSSPRFYISGGVRVGNPVTTEPVTSLRLFIDAGSQFRIGTFATLEGSVAEGDEGPSLDSDGDGLLDGAEVNIYGTDPFDPDSDGDGLLDGAEVNIYGTDPLDPDSDGDGLLDGAEVNTYGTDPLDPLLFR